MVLRSTTYPSAMTKSPTMQTAHFAATCLNGMFISCKHSKYTKYVCNYTKLFGWTFSKQLISNGLNRTLSLSNLLRAFLHIQ